MISSPNNNYARGAQFERKVKDYLESKGFYAVRAAGSHGLTDVIAIAPLKYLLEDMGAVILFIQCKTGKATMSKADRIKLHDEAIRHSALPYLVELSATGEMTWYLLLGDGSKRQEGF